MDRYRWVLSHYETICKFGGRLKLGAYLKSFFSGVVGLAIVYGYCFLVTIQLPTVFFVYSILCLLAVTFFFGKYYGDLQYINWLDRRFSGKAVAHIPAVLPFLRSSYGKFLAVRIQNGGIVRVKDVVRFVDEERKHE